MENEELEISHPILVYSFLILIITFSVTILHVSKRGIRISKYLKQYNF